MIEASQHPFINATVTDNKDLLISVDGPYALNYTLAEENKTESINIKVNEQTFKFTIKLFIPLNETQSN